MSFFDKIQQLPEDPILSLPLLFNADPRQKKVNLGIGAYRDENGKPVILSAVKKAEEIIFSQKLNKEYQPIEGDPSYVQNVKDLIFGQDAHKEHVGTVQTIGGTGALRLGAEFFVRHGYTHIYLSIYLAQSRTRLSKGGYADSYLSLL